jgi:NTP pyrophosphatase (non-canonical NTP hydrolase)
MSIDELSKTIWQHLDERDWLEGKPQSLAISIALEASELLEHYQWSEKPVGDKQALAEELADIFIYAFQFAQVNEIDIAQAIQDKLAKAAKKYPSEQFKGKKGQERSDAWIKAKTTYRKEGL